MRPGRLGRVGGGCGAAPGGKQSALPRTGMVPIKKGQTPTRAFARAQSSKAGNGATHHACWKGPQARASDGGGARTCNAQNGSAGGPRTARASRPNRALYVCDACVCACLADRGAVWANPRECAQGHRCGVCPAAASSQVGSRVCSIACWRVPAGGGYTGIRVRWRWGLDGGDCGDDPRARKPSRCWVGRLSPPHVYRCRRRNPLGEALQQRTHTVAWQATHWTRGGVIRVCSAGGQ